MTIKISIIVNCYNGEKYLSRCLKSIISQTINNWELIFFDNQSEDNSKKIFENFKEKKFKYFKSSYFMKLYEARNEAIKKTKGEYIAFLDCDDWWEANHLEEAMPFFNNKDLVFYFSNAYNYFEKKKFFKLHKKNLPKKNIFNDLIDDYSVKISSLILKKNLPKDNISINFDDNFNIIGDYDLVMKIASKYECYSNDKPTVNCSFHGENYSLLNRDEYVDEFNIWYKKIDFSNSKFLENKKNIQENILYINLFRDITKYKDTKSLIKIFKIKKMSRKLKLFLIFMTPKFIIKKLLNKYQL